MNEHFEKGLAVFADVYGPEMAEGCRKGAASGDDFTALHIKFSMELPFGQVWTREDKLSRRDRSLAVLGMCIGQRSFDEIRYHTIMGVANGLTRAEIEEVFFSTIPYCGFPAANTAKAAMLEGFKILEEQGKL
jgi:alkylhydroperoxidase/carboxymuconolactone decarboxylase family protein YurZ